MIPEEDVVGVVAMEAKSAASSRNSSAGTKSKRGSAKSCLMDGSRPQTEGSQRKVRFSESSSANSRSRSAGPNYILEFEASEDPEKNNKIEGGEMFEGDDTNAEDLAMAREEYGQGDYFADENLNNNNNTKKSEPLRMSVNDMMTGFANPDEVKTLRSSVGRFRPKSGRKMWEDVQKPDSNVSDLAVSGKSQGLEEDACQISIQITKKKRGESAKGTYVHSAAARVYSRGSPRGPQSLGPKEFREAEKRREIERARAPQSAMVLYDPIEVEPQPKAIEARPTTPKPKVGLGSGKRRIVSSTGVRRVTSAQRKQNSGKGKKTLGSNTAVRSQTRCSSAHTYDPRIPVWIQCCVCAKKVKKYLTEEEALNKNRIMCKDCKTIKGIVADYNAIANPSRHVHEAARDEVNDAPLAIEYEPDIVNEDELGIIEDEVASDEEIQDYELLTNMEDIEKSLLEVRKEIQESHVKLTEKEEEMGKKVRFADSNEEDVFLTEAKEIANVTISEVLHEAYEEKEKEHVSELSSVLLDCKELPPKIPAVKPLLNHMQVFHFNEAEEENGGDVTSYPVSYMGDDTQQEQEQGFLEMLVNELPEEENIIKP